MKRFSGIGKMVGAALVLGGSAAAAQQPAAAPVVAVWYFDNNSVGGDASSYAGLEKGIADLLITDLASNQRLRVVERGRIEQILQEQNLARTGSVDEQTAVRLGRLLNACYSVVGGFMKIGDRMVLTGRAVSIETGRVTNPQRVESRGDDVLGLIGQLTQKLNADMRLEGCPGGAAGASRDAAQQGNATPPAAGAQGVTKEAGKAPATPPGVVTYAKPLSAETKKVKLDFQTAMLYSKALDAQDRNDATKAADLYRQVLTKFPEFGPAKENLAKVSKSGE